MARALAVAVVALVVLLAGCAGPSDPPMGDGEGPRESDDRDTTVAQWVATGCEEVLLESYAPAAFVQALVPARHEVRELVPGVTIVGAAVSSCDTWTLDNVTVLRDVRQARLEVLLKGGVDWFVLEWIVDDAAFADALARHGVRALTGEVATSTPAVGLPGMTLTTITAADGARAAFTWLPSTNDGPSPSEGRLLQDADGADVEVVVRMGATFSGSFDDNCTYEAEAELWRSVFQAPARECLPFHIPETSLAYRLNIAPG